MNINALPNIKLEIKQKSHTALRTFLSNKNDHSENDQQNLKYNKNVTPYQEHLHL